MAAHRMTPARRAALKKAQIASARKRRKGIRGKVGSTVKNRKAKRGANKVLFKSAIKNQRRVDRSARFAKKARRAKTRARFHADKSARLASKSKRLARRSQNASRGKDVFGGRIKGAPARFKKRRKAAIAHAKRYG